jgi:hypothetical protein
MTHTIYIRVAPGGELPAVGTTGWGASIQTRLIYTVRVTSIKALRWLDDGSIMVTIRGRKVLPPV